MSYSTSARCLLSAGLAGRALLLMLLPLLGFASNKTTALAEKYSNALVVFVSGEAADVSSLGPHQASAALLATRNPAKRPRDVPSFYLPNVVTSFAERRSHKPADLLGCRGHKLEEGALVASKENTPRNGPVAYMYSRCDRPVREAFFDLLVDRGVSVDALGACQGNRTPDIPLRRRGRASPTWHDDAVEAYTNYRLVIAFENGDDEGYITEKIANAFLAGAVPVYWGTADAMQAFNPKSFIHCGEFTSLEACADRVAEVARNDTLWGEYFSQPCCSGGGGSDGRLAEWLSWLDLETPPPPSPLSPNITSPIPPPPIEAGQLRTAESKRSSSSSSGGSSSSSCSSSGSDGSSSSGSDSSSSSSDSSNGSSSSRSNSSSSDSSSSSSSSSLSLRDWLVGTLRMASQARHNRDINSCKR